MNVVVKRILRIVLGIVLIAVGAVSYDLGVRFGLLQPLTRPGTVSTSARYVSLIEIGTWFDCYVDSKKDVDVCKAWDSDGRLLADGEFRLEGENRAATRSELRPSRVNGGVGRIKYIELEGDQGPFSKVLVPVGTPPPRIFITYPP